MIAYIGILLAAACRTKLGLASLGLLSILGLYALYVVKMKLGIDLLPNGGLHLPGPRTLLRQILHFLASP